jgi:hypothetical protein
MQSEIIYLPNAKVMLLEELTNCFKGNLLGNTIKIQNIEKMGKPFSFLSNHTFNDSKSFHYKPEQIFRELINPVPLSNNLEYYLTNAEVEFTLSEKENKEIQYLGIIHGKPTNFHYKIKISNSPEWEAKKSIIPCQFYLIKDKL